MKYIFTAIIVIHGLIHFMGFAKAFDFGDMKQLTLPVSRPAGLFWLLAGVLFIISALLFMLKKDSWLFLVFPTVIISIVLIIMSWKDAKAGTIANLLILLVAILQSGSIWFERTYQQDVKELLAAGNSASVELLTEADIQHLPLPVQRYLIYTGVLNKPRVRNVKLVVEGQMREKGKNFFPMVYEQYSFFEDPARLFFMKGKMYGLTVPGYHKYSNASATMDIRLFGFFSIIKKTGVEMNKAETVTFFNDMCLLAPATLIDKRIKWQTIDEYSVNATFTNQGISISATLFFNSNGQLVNFISNDRISVSDMKNYPFSTPVHHYQDISGFKLMSEGDAVWHYPDGAFVYGKFKLKSIAYNVRQ